MIKKYAIVVFVKTSLDLCLIAFFVLSGFGLTGALLALIISGIISLIMMLFFIFSYAGVSRPNFSLLKPFLLYGLPLIPISLSEFVIEASDRYAIGFFLGAEKVGIYSASYNIGLIPLMFSTYLIYILSATVYGLYDNGNVNEAKMYLSYSWKYLLMITIPSIFGLSILARPLLNYLTTSQFTSDGVYIIPFVALSSTLWGMEQIFAVALLVFKRRKIFVIAFISGALVNIILNIILIPRYGVIAAAVTTLTAYIILTIIIGYSSCRHITFNLHLRFIAKCFLASIVMTFCIWIINPINIFGVIISIVFGFSLYFCLLLLLKGFKRQELLTIFEIFGLGKFYEKIDTSINRIKK
jgi:O-antigen/teichoic acid export membrane protein